MYQKVSNIGLKDVTEDYLCSKKIKNLRHIFKEELEARAFSIRKKQAFHRRYDQALTPYHFVSYIFHPQKRNYKLSLEEINFPLESLGKLFEDKGLLQLAIIKRTLQSF